MSPLSEDGRLTGSRLEALHNLIEKIAVRRSQGQDFLLASGKRSNLYFDLRKVTQNPDGLILVGSLMLEKIGELGLDVDCAGGLETGAIPISTAISLLAFERGKKIGSFWVRKRPKEHGLQNRIEGNLLPASRALIVEDTVTTGGSLLQAIDSVRESGATVVYAAAIVDRGGGAALGNVGVPFFSLFSERDFTLRE